MRKLNNVLLISLTLLLIATAALAGSSVCVKFERSKVLGTGPLPYNYRIIDGRIHAGGHPLGPTNDLGNTDQQALSILDYLRSKGVVTVIDLENTGRIEARYERLLKIAGLKLLHIPMSMTKVPDQTEWRRIRVAMEKPVYIHCKWGVDRTGAVIAKYLIEEKGYSIDEAIKAVEKNGSHAGVMGGIKKVYVIDPVYRKFWERQDPVIPKPKFQTAMAY